MKADLHIHSCYSNGFFDPSEILRLSVKHKLNHIAIVDECTFAGVDAAKAVFSDSPVNLIEGIEIPARDRKRNQSVTILGYNISNRKYVEQLCESLLTARTNQTLRQLSFIQKQGYKIKEEEVRDTAKNPLILYPCHIFRVLKRKGYDDRSIKPSQSVDLLQGANECFVDVYEVIEAIKIGDGMTVLGCPGKSKTYELIPELASFGLDGLEKYHPAHRTFEQNILQELIDQYKFACFGGSDFHGESGAGKFASTLITDVREFPDILLQNYTKVH